MKLKNKISHIFIWMLTILFFILPIFITILTTLKSNTEFTMVPRTIIPNEIYLGNFLNVFKKMPFLSLFANTIFLCLASGIISITISIFLGYILAYKEFKGKKLLVLFVILNLIIPTEIYMSTWLKYIGIIGLYNNLLALLLPFLFSSFGILFMWKVFKNIPTNIITILKLECKNDFEIVRRFLITYIFEDLKILFIYLSLFCWESFMWPILVNYSTKKLTLTSGLSQFMGAYYIDMPLLITATLFSTLPYIFLSIFLFKKNKKGGK